VKVNITAVLTPRQVKAVAAVLDPSVPPIVSVFAGRIADTGVDPMPIMKESIEILSDLPKAELLWASVREVLNVFQAAACRCHMVPVALLQKTSLIHDFPARILTALIAGACVYFFFQLAKAFGPDYVGLKPKPLARRILLALFPVFGTWTWCNLGTGGAWQIALGLALLGETAALYFTLVRPSPFIAGV